MTYDALYSLFVIVFMFIPYVVAVVFGLRLLWYLGSYFKKKLKDKD